MVRLRPARYNNPMDETNIKIDPVTDKEVGYDDWVKKNGS